MAQVEGLNLRGSRWYVRILVPNNLQDAYGTARKNISLETSERLQAVLKATLKRAEWLAAFEAKRRELNPLPLLVVTPEMSAELAQRVYAAVLREDDSFRSDLPLFAELANAREELRKHRTVSGRLRTLEPALISNKREACAMSEFINGLSSLSWWLSVVVVGVLVNFISQALYPRLAMLPTHGFNLARKAARDRQKFIDARIDNLNRDPSRLPLYLAAEFRNYWLALFFLCGAIVLLLGAVTAFSFLPAQLQNLKVIVLAPAAVLVFFSFFSVQRGFIYLEVVRSFGRNEQAHAPPYSNGEHLRT